jgi:hypothetical protein
MMKKCTKCKLNKERSEFHKNKTKRDGLQSWCKVCKIPLDTKLNKKRSIEYKRKVKVKYYNTDNGKEHRYADKLRSREAHPKMHIAHQCVYRAIKSGRLIKQPCEECGETEVEAHHDDYSKPLDVRWLCMEHHKKLHRVAKC